MPIRVLNATGENTMTERTWAKATDCCDCGQSDAEHLFSGTDPICEGCADQYQPEDLTPAKG